MRAFLKFNRGVLKMPLPWRLWLMLLVTANLVVPLLFIRQLEMLGEETRCFCAPRVGCRGGDDGLCIFD